METYDLIIIGSGSGNSIPESFSNKKVAIIEKGTFGGTCLNVGCIPSKMFVLPGDFANAVNDSGKLGVKAKIESVDWPAITARVFGRIDPIAKGGQEYRAESENIDLIQGLATFVGPKIVEVNGRQLTAENILIATGARPVIPDIPGIETVKVHTSDTVMRLEELPESMAIIGGGFIAAEMGHVFSALGTNVTLFNRSNTLLKAQDADISKRFIETFGKRVNLTLGELPTKINNSDNSIVLETQSGTEEFEVLLVATGRVRNNDLLNLDTAGVDVDDRGIIVVDENMQTNVEGVWAIGDAANSYQLKHVANAEAKIAFHNIANTSEMREVSYKAVPHAVFSDPQIASVGLTETQAKDAGIKYVVGMKDYAATAYGWALEDDESFAKVLVNPDSRLIIGAHIIGPQAATLIQPIIQAMSFDQTVDDVAKNQFYIHPALTEVVENALLEAINSMDVL